MERRASGSFQSQVIERLDRIEHRVDTLEQRLPQRRREITKTTRLHLADATLALGGRCPCCGRVDIVDADGTVVNAEFDHFYSNRLPNEEHCWLICLWRDNLDERSATIWMKIGSRDEVMIDAPRQLCK